MNNREIKFRIWDNHTKHFATCVYETNKDCYLCIGRSGYVTAFNCYGDEIDFPDGRFVVQQYTGLKDKNGKEIYEGDICNAGMVIGDVNYSIGGFYLASNPLMEYFKGYPDNMNVLSPDWDYSWIDVEVIGNVMQNPELIKNNDNNNQ